MGRVSPTSNFGTINGYSYSGRAAINTSIGNAYAVAVLNSTTTAPSGYMGASAYLYQESTGQCVDYTLWAYNSSPTTFLNPGTSSSGGTARDAYMAGGSFKMYTGSSYIEKGCSNSPYLNNY